MVLNLTYFVVTERQITNYKANENGEVHTKRLALDNLSENNMLPVEMRCGRDSNKEL